MENSDENIPDIINMKNCERMESEVMIIENAPRENAKQTSLRDNDGMFPYNIESIEMEAQENANQATQDIQDEEDVQEMVSEVRDKGKISGKGRGGER